MFALCFYKVSSLVPWQSMEKTVAERESNIYEQYFIKVLQCSLSGMWDILKLSIVSYAK